MAGLAPRRIPNVVFGLTLFWSAIGSAFYWDAGFSFGFLWPWLLAIALGGFVGHISSATYRSDILERLRFRKDAAKSTSEPNAFRNSSRGVICTLGPIPFIYPAPKQIEAYSFETLLEHRPKELTSEQFKQMFSPRLMLSDGHNRAENVLLDGLVRVFLHADHLHTPAGIDLHKGRSLLTHSLLVSALMLHRAPGYTYMRNRSINSVSPIDPNYKLDSLDPLIAIIGLSHDFGKLRTLAYDGQGKPVGFGKNHGSHNSRLMALVPEFWNPSLQLEDRRIIQCVLAHAGNVAMTPVQKNNNNPTPLVTSDRLHALQDLLGECDRIASAIEMGQKYDFTTLTASTSQAAEPAAVAVDMENNDSLLAALAQFLCQSVVNSPLRSSIFKYKDLDFSQGKDLLIIDEKAFVARFSAFIGRPNLAARSGKSSTLTKRLLELLDDRHYLFRMDEPGRAQRSAATCLYKMQITRDAGEEIELTSVFLIDVGQWQAVHSLIQRPNDCAFVAFGGTRFGGQGHGGTSMGTPKPKLKSASQKASKVKTPSQLIEQIGQAFVTNRIFSARSFDDYICVIGCDQFFIDLGIQVREYQAAEGELFPSELAGIGILKIKKSESAAGHVLYLDKRLYHKFLPNLSLDLASAT